MQLADYLTWEADAGRFDGYAARFREKAEQRLARALGVAREHASDVILDIANDLPSDSLLSLAAAPELEFRLRQASVDPANITDLLAFLYRSLEAEILLANQRMSALSPEALWTACGDRNLNEARRSSAPDVGIRGWPEAICLDFSSPHNRGDLPHRFPSHRDYQQRDHEALARKLEEALSLVTAGGKPVVDFVATFTTVVVFLQVNEVSQQFGSFSSSWYPGRSVLLNSHTPGMLVADMAAAMVHEAIHSLIDVSELEGHMLAAGASFRESVTSPWTGASISLPSLIDAYFVWYGLAHFWRKVAERDRTGDSDGRILKCIRGFAPPLARVIGPAPLEAIDPFAQQAIAGLQSSIRQLA